MPAAAAAAAAARSDVATLGLTPPHNQPAFLFLFLHLSSYCGGDIIAHPTRVCVAWHHGSGNSSLPAAPLLSPVVATLVTASKHRHGLIGGPRLHLRVSAAAAARGSATDTVAGGKGRGAAGRGYLVEVGVVFLALAAREHGCVRALHARQQVGVSTADPPRGAGTTKAEKLAQAKSKCLQTPGSTNRSTDTGVCNSPGC